MNTHEKTHGDWTAAARREPAAAAASPNDAWATVVMPGQTERLAQEIEAESPEGRPADAKAGPAALWGLIGATLVVLATAALVSAFWIGWAGAGLAAGLGLLALVLNPAVGAAVMRAEERKRVLEHKPHEKVSFRQ